MGDTTVRWRLLGDVGASVDGDELSIRTKRSRAVLAFLLLNANDRVSTDRLVDALWGEHPPRTARNSVQRFVADLRRDLDAAGSRIVTVDGGYRLALDVDDEVDADRLTECITTARRLHADARWDDALATLDRGMDRWTGEPLDGIGEAAFVATHRRRLEELALDGLQLRIQCDLALGLDAELVPELLALVEEYPYHEAFWASLMQALYAAGRQREALATFDRLRSRLVDDLGIEPSPPLRELVQRILDHDGTLLPRRRPASDVDEPERRLAAPTTAFFGRDEERRLVERLLTGPAPAAITLLGPGGVGKTRLAACIVEQIGPTFPGGVLVASLDGTTEHARVPVVVAGACGAELDQPDRPLDAIVRQLDGRECLLVIDNAEHVVEAVAGVVTEIIRHAPSVRILTTSRSMLAIGDEHVVELGGLDLTTAPGDRVSPAAALFLERAARLVGEIEPGPDVDRVCALVGGLPLALELTARWTVALTPRQIVERLERGLDVGDEVLSTTATDVPARHRSMRTVLDQTWTSLSHAQRQVMAALTVFRSSFDLTAATDVAGAGPLRLVELVGRSLLTRRPGGRFAIHELIRQYAADHLAAHDRATIEARHRDHFLERLGVAGARLRGSDAAHETQMLAADVENLVAAWTSAIDDHLDVALRRAAPGLAEFLAATGRWSEAIELLDRAATIGSGVHRATMAAYRITSSWKHVDHAETTDVFDAALGLIGGDTDGEALARAVLLAAQAKSLTEKVGDADAAQALVDEGLELSERLGDDVLAADFEVVAAMVDRIRGDFATAGTRLAEARRRYDLADDLRGACDAEGMLAAVCAEQGLVWEALEADLRALELRTRSGDRLAIEIAEGNTGASYVLLGAWDEARAHTLRALDVATELDDAPMLPYLECQLAEIDAGDGRRRDAERRFARGIRELRRTEFSLGLRLKLPEWGRFLVEEDRWQEAELVLDEAAAVWRQLGGDHFSTTVDAIRARALLGKGAEQAACALATDAWNRIAATAGRSLPYPIESVVDCLLVFEATGRDDEAADALELGDRLVRTMVTSIDDPTYRRTFLALPDVVAVVERAAAMGCTAGARPGTRGSRRADHL